MENIDFNNLATKEDLKIIHAEMATKEELSKVYFNLDTKIDNVKNELKKEIKEKGDQILTSNDKQIKILEEMRIELAAHNVSYKRHDEKITDHEKRIITLELKPAHF